MLDLSAGQLVADKYRIDGVIGAGGMGVVLAATHLDLDQLVAIKVLRDVNDEAVVRFQREARLVVRLKSEHVARVFDVGTLDDDTPYYVMERLEGQDLSKILEQGGPLPVDRAVDYVLEACEAIAEAHMLGMVHRDLKPANLFVARGPGGLGSVKVLDFGVSKAALTDTAFDGELTDDGVALGSPGYMAPEQIESSRAVDARADIYSLGAILYRLTSGSVPHKGDTLMSLLASMSSEPVTPLSDRVPGIPMRFAEIVQRCLAHDPAARPKSVAALAAEIVPFGTRKAQASAEAIFATMGHGKGPTSETITIEHQAVPRDDPDPTTAMMDTTVHQPILAQTQFKPASPPFYPAALPAMVSTDPHSSMSTALTRPPPNRNPNVLPLGIAAGFLIAVVAWVALSRAPKPPRVVPATQPAIVVVEAGAEPLPSVVAAPTSVPPPETESAAPPASQRPPAGVTRPSRHPSPAPRPAPRRDPSAPPNLTEMPGGRH